MTARLSKKSQSRCHSLCADALTWQSKVFYFLLDQLRSHRGQRKTCALVKTGLLVNGRCPPNRSSLDILRSSSVRGVCREDEETFVGLTKVDALLLFATPETLYERRAEDTGRADLRADCDMYERRSAGVWNHRQ